MCCAISSGCTRAALRLGAEQPGFPALRQGFGVAPGVSTADGLRGALSEAMAANAPALIEVITDITKDYPP